MFPLSFRRAACASLALAVPVLALAAPVDPAVRTIQLNPDHSFSVPSSVAYHPGFNRYYASDTGSTGAPAFVFSAGGGVPLQVLQPLNIDPRAWNYNANTGQLEIVSFNACCEAGERGLIAPGIDGSGDLTGGTSNLLAPLPGLPGGQVAPAYNPASNVFYARDTSSTVTVVNRTTGASAGTINLDFGSAGAISVPDDGIVYVPEEGWLGVVDQGDDELVVFDLAGNFIANIQLDIDVTSDSRRPGYANGQLFVYDITADQWQGYQVTSLGGGGGPGGGPSVPIPTLGTWGLLAALLLLMGFGLREARRRP